MSGQHLLTLDQILALADPTRDRLISALRVRPKSSVAELACELSRKPTSLYAHLAKLEQVGLITKSGERLNKNIKEALYSVVHESLSLDMSCDDPEYIAAHLQAVANRLREMGRNYSAAYGHRSLRQSTFIKTAQKRVSGKRLAEINRSILFAMSDTKPDDAEDAMPVSFLFIWTPTDDDPPR